jgi:hypothetical protein
MKKQIYSEISIRAPVAVVWAALANTAGYAKWNPFITRVEGPLEPGTRPRVSVVLEPQRTLTFRPRLIRVLARREIRWIGRAGFAGFLDEEHSLAVESGDADSTRFIHEATFSGIFVPFLWLYLKPRLNAGFVEMNEALKKYVEGS